MKEAVTKGRQPSNVTQRSVSCDSNRIVSEFGRTADPEPSTTVTITSEAIMSDSKAHAVALKTMPMLRAFEDSAIRTFLTAAREYNLYLRSTSMAPASLRSMIDPSILPNAERFIKWQDMTPVRPLSKTASAREEDAAAYAAAWDQVMLNALEKAIRSMYTSDEMTEDLAESIIRRNVSWDTRHPNFMNTLMAFTTSWEKTVHEHGLHEIIGGDMGGKRAVKVLISLLKPSFFKETVD